MSLFLTAIEARADTAYYALDNVFFLKNGTTTNFKQLHGYFSWTYSPGDFENGTGQFLYLDIPGTLHDHTNLHATIETKSIEVTLAGSVHDDGIDISLVLLSPLSATAPSTIDTTLSKFEIGGNGFYSGTISRGSVVPFDFSLIIKRLTATSMRLTWTPHYSWCVLQESPSLAPGSWTTATGASPLDVSVGNPKMFYRLMMP